MTSCNITVPNVSFFLVDVHTHHHEAETDKSKDLSDCRLKDISDMDYSKKLNDNKSEIYL